MLDSIIVSPAVHMAIGSIVLLTNLIFLIAAVISVKKTQDSSISNFASFAFILFQLALMLQILIGVKLLDQGLGVLQLYIHYVGGLAPFAFCLFYYWQSNQNGRRLVWVAGLSFFFVLLTFGVGSMASIS